MSSFLSYCTSEGPPPLTNEPERFDMRDIFPSVTNLMPLLQGFQCSEHFDNLCAYDGAADVLMKTKSMGYNNIIITACGDTEGVMESRNRSIANAFGSSIEDVIYLPYGGSKLNTLSDLPKGVFIDDQLARVLEGNAAGHKSLLKVQSYNKNDADSSIIRIDNLHDVLAHIK